MCPRQLVALLAGLALGTATFALAAPADPYGAALPTRDTRPPEGVQIKSGSHVGEDQGVVTYTVPLDLPPGRHGLAPHLGLRYSSNGALRGTLAAGWTIDGLPKIERDPTSPTIAIYRYEGELLVPAPGDAGTGTRYRPVHDDGMTRIEKAGLTWKVSTPDGVVRTFAGVTESSDSATIWNLTREEDQDGNSVEYAWSRKPFTISGVVANDRVPTTIEYTLNLGAAVQAHARVVFDFGPTNVPASEICPGGAVPIGAALDQHFGRTLVRGSRRLAAVSMDVRDTSGGAWRPARRYDLTYVASELACTNDRPALRMLDHVTETAYDAVGTATVAPPVTFTYGPTQRDMSLVYTSGTQLGDRGDQHGPLGALMDLDGDGIADQVRAAPPAPGSSRCRLMVRRGAYGGGFASVYDEQAFELPTAPWGRDTDASVLLGDDACTLDGQLAEWGGGHAATAGGPCWRDTVQVNYRFLDWDHDGDLDLVTWAWTAGFASLGPDFGGTAPADSPQNPPPTCGAPGAGSDCSCSAGQTPDGVGGCRPECASGETWSQELGRCVYDCDPFVEHCEGPPGGGEPPPSDQPPPTPSTCLPASPAPEAHDRIRIYLNTGGAFSTTPQVIVDPPVALPPNGHQFELPLVGVVGLSTLVDIDGDGRQDMIALDPSNLNLGSATAFRVWRGTVAGGFEPTYTVWSKGTWTQATGSTSPNGATTVTTTSAADWVDVDGDGLLDLLVLATPPGGSSAVLGVSYNRQGSFTAFRSLGTTGPTETVRTELSDPWNGTTQLRTGWRAEPRRLVDVDEDGLPELFLESILSNTSVQATAAARYILRLDGDVYAATTSRATTWEPLERLVRGRNAFGWFRQSDFVDITGDGRADLVTFTDDGLATIRTDAPWFGAPRLLASVTNGRGATVGYTYGMSTDPTVVTTTTGERNAPRWVVRTATTSAGAGQPPSIDTYAYSHPVYGADSPLDPGLSHFLGFQTITVDHSGQQGAASSRMTDTFTYATGADHRAHLATTWTYIANATGFAPVRFESSEWTTAPLVGGLATFTYRGTHTTRTCDPGATALQCAALGENVLTETEIYTPWSTSGPALFYENTESRRERPLPASGVERRVIARDYQERVGQSPYAAADYRVLLLDETMRLDGSTAILTRAATTYDTAGRPTDTFVSISTSAVAHTQRTFDGVGNVVTVKRPLQFANGTNNVVTTTYDTQKLYAAKTVNELGHTVNEVHDLGTGELVRREGPNKRTGGKCLTPSCVVYEPEEWSRDGFGRVLEHRVATDPAIGTGYALTPIEWTHYIDGTTSSRAVERLRDLGQPTKLVTIDRYDGLGRTVETREVGSPDASTTYDYDARGDLARVTSDDPSSDGARVATVYTRDGLGRVTQIARPDGTVELTSYLGLAEENRAYSASDALYGPMTRLDHDAFGRLAAVHQPDATGDHVTSYGYDGADRVTSVIDADGATTALTYDQMGRRITVTRGARTWTYGYDVDGNTTSVQTPIPSGGAAADYTTITSYDDLDRVRVHTPATRGMLSPQLASLGIGPTTTSYDTGANGVGHPSMVTLAAWGTVAYGYDVRGKVAGESRTISLTQGAAVTQVQSVTRAYNALGAPTGVTWDDGTSWRTSYDGRGRIDRVTWHDPAEGDKAVASYTRSIAGPPRARDNAYGQRREWTYDHAGRVATERVWRTADPGSSAAEHGYGYDAFGRLTAVTGWVSGHSAGADYTYDGRGRIASAVGPEAYAADLTYTPAGNVKTARVTGALDAPDRDVTYQYGAVDPQAVDRLVGPGGSTFAHIDYDRAGNVTSRTIGTRLWQLTTDGDDRIRQVSGPDGTERYYFGPEGERMVSITTGGVSWWFGESETHFLTTGMQTRRWHHIAAGEVLARVDNHTGIELQYEDALHDLVLTMSPTAVTTAFQYGAFGEVADARGATDDHTRRFNGKPSDATSGLRHYGYRSYDPVLLRWTAADPQYRFAPETAYAEPQRANLYAFSLNDPLRYYDPDGRDPWAKEHREERRRRRRAAAEKAKRADEKRAAQKFPIMRRSIRPYVPDGDDTAPETFAKGVLVGDGLSVATVGAAADAVTDYIKHPPKNPLTHPEEIRRAWKLQFEAAAELVDEIETIMNDDEPVNLMSLMPQP